MPSSHMVYMTLFYSQQREVRSSGMRCTNTQAASISTSSENTQFAHSVAVGITVGCVLLRLHSLPHLVSHLKFHCVIQQRVFSK